MSEATKIREKMEVAQKAVDIQAKYVDQAKGDVASYSDRRSNQASSDYKATLAKKKQNLADMKKTMDRLARALESIKQQYKLAASKK